LFCLKKPPLRPESGIDETPHFLQHPDSSLKPNHTMGLFDSLAKQAMSSLLGGSSSGGGLDLGAITSLLSNQAQASEAVSGLFNQVGGVNGLLEKFNQAGLGDAVSSWVGTGANQPIEASQLESAVGPDLIQGFASKLGLQGSQILPLLTQFLPVIIDKLTPSGAVESNQPSSDTLQNVLASVVKGALGGGRA
jgi:uncharacterized protein YidB (DUF937 family)